MLHDLFTMEINGKMSGGVEYFCFQLYIQLLSLMITSSFPDIQLQESSSLLILLYFFFFGYFSAN